MAWTKEQIAAAARVMDPGAFHKPIYGAEFWQQKRLDEVLQHARRVLEATEAESGSTEVEE